MAHGPIMLLVYYCSLRFPTSAEGAIAARWPSPLPGRFLIDVITGMSVTQFLARYIAIPTSIGRSDGRSNIPISLDHSVFKTRCNFIPTTCYHVEPMKVYHLNGKGKGKGKGKRKGKGEGSI